MSSYSKRRARPTDNLLSQTRAPKFIAPLLLSFASNCLLAFARLRPCLLFSLFVAAFEVSIFILGTTNGSRPLRIPFHYVSVTK
jgi:hypothetical protein